MFRQAMSICPWHDEVLKICEGMFMWRHVYLDTCICDISITVLYSSLCSQLLSDVLLTHSFRLNGLDGNGLQHQWDKN